MRLFSNGTVRLAKSKRVVKGAVGTQPNWNVFFTARCRRLNLPKNWNLKPINNLVFSNHFFCDSEGSIRFILLKINKICLPQSLYT